jgi:hypothetical protein
VTESSPSEEITLVKAGGVLVSAWGRWTLAYAIISNLCGPIVDVSVRVHVAVLFVNVHDPNATVVLLPGFA